MIIITPDIATTLKGISSFIHFYFSVLIPMSSAIKVALVTNRLITKNYNLSMNMSVKLPRDILVMS